jgi:hypothetical protein
LLLIGVIEDLLIPCSLSTSPPEGCEGFRVVSKEVEEERGKRRWREWAAGLAD